jgi:two-component system, sensor histidine kinase
VSAILDRTLPSTASGASSLSSGLSPAILYVDDEDMIRDIYHKVLLRAGYSVDLAENGLAASDFLQRKKYDLLITDVDMPQLTGLELAVRARRAGMALPIIIASGCVSFSDDGAYAFLRLSSTLRKPFTVEAMLQTVETVLCAAPLADHP